jgi:hypothetical protein
MVGEKPGSRAAELKMLCIQNGFPVIKYTKSASRSSCRAALINENCISRVFSSFSRLSASGMALNCKKPGTKIWDKSTGCFSNADLEIDGT